MNPIPEEFHDKREIVVSSTNIFNPPLRPGINILRTTKVQKRNIFEQYSDLLFSSSASIISILATSEACRIQMTIFDGKYCKKEEEKKESKWEGIFFSHLNVGG